MNAIDKYTAESLTHFLKIEKQYSDNYCGQLLKLLKIILRDAEKSGLEVHPYSNYIESFKQKSSDRILHILNPMEIKALKELQHIPEDYADSYKWLLIGLCIGQRVSDLLKLSPNNLRKAPTGLYIDIIQQKTRKSVTVGVVDSLVIEILENEFPRKVSQVVFNKQIKISLCWRNLDIIEGRRNSDTKSVLDMECSLYRKVCVLLDGNDISHRILCKWWHTTREV